LYQKRDLGSMEQRGTGHQNHQKRSILVIS